MAQGGGWRLPVAMLAVCILVLLALLLLQFKHPPPRYHACILSISRIDDSNLELNISVGVESGKPLWGRTCLERGTDVAVAYLSLPLARAATVAEVCGGWYGSVWVYRCTTVLARTSQVGGLPRSVADGVVADARRGAAVFYVTFPIEPAGPGDGDDGKQATCAVRFNNNSRNTACDVQ
ncbi:unnamed protein product [Alopecurus aequalis]